jgi:HEAT repeat protein
MNESCSGKAKSVEQLLSDLRRHNWSVNWKTADALAELGEYAFLHLLRALEDQDGYVRNGAAIALGKIGNGDATQPLIKALQWRDDRVYEDDEDQEARTSAATALGKLRNDVACKALIAELEKRPNTDSTVASYIVEALGEIGDPKAVPVIARAIDSGDFELQKIASCALTKLGRDGIAALLRMAADRDQPVRPYVIRALGTNSVESATPLLLQIVETPSEDKYVRCQAAEALGRIGGSPKILPVLLATLRAFEEEVRNGALYGLGALHDSRAYNAIVEQLDSQGHHYVAIMALGELGDPRACELLIPMLKSGDGSVTVHAATALGKIGCTRALPSLIQLRDLMTVSDSALSRAHRVVVEGQFRNSSSESMSQVPWRA